MQIEKRLLRAAFAATAVAGMAAGGALAEIAVVPRPKSVVEVPGANVPADTRIEYHVDKSIPEEGYVLDTSNGGISIASSGEEGRFYAEMTLRQLKTDGGYPRVKIEDSPRFPYRGVHLDVARHFFGKDSVKRLLKTMAEHKFNVFHIHLTDSQGWRFPMPKYPGLTAKGPAYTESDIREIVEYAAKLHITVVPEIDLPGHSGAALAKFRKFRCWTKDKKARHVFCLGNDDAIKFIKDVMDELCRQFPGKLIHIGGDEVSPAWKSCSLCRKRMDSLGVKTNQEYQAWFTKMLSEYLASKGRRAVGWDEIVFNGSAPGGAIVMSWRGKEGGVAAAAAGSECIMCPTSHCYFDYTQLLPGDKLHYFGKVKRGMATSLEEAYSYNPLEGIPPEQAKFVLGGQCNNWTECTATEKDLQWKLWPRAAAMAEVFWSPAELRDFSDFTRRMEIHRQRLINEGVNCARLK